MRDGWRINKVLDSNITVLNKAASISPTTSHRATTDAKTLLQSWPTKSYKKNFFSRIACPRPPPSSVTSPSLLPYLAIKRPPQPPPRFPRTQEQGRDGLLPAPFIPQGQRPTARLGNALLPSLPSCRPPSLHHHDPGGGADQDAEIGTESARSAHPCPASLQPFLPPSLSPQCPRHVLVFLFLLTIRPPSPTSAHQFDRHLIALSQILLLYLQAKFAHFVQFALLLLVCASDLFGPFLFKAFHSSSGAPSIL